MTHLCRFCERDLPLNAFPANRQKTGWKCRDCIAAYRRKWREDNPDKAQGPSYWRKYHREVGRFAKRGITKDLFEEMWRDQAGCCAICQDPFLDPCKVAIDHDHSCCPARVKACGRCVRGLLCSNCNTAIGLLQESTTRLQAAVQYLEERSL